MKKGVFPTIDFGNLDDPIESERKRASFCGKVVVAKPIIEELVRRMMREVGKTYFGQTKTTEELWYFNGIIDGLEGLVERVGIYESEHLAKQNKANDIDDNPISSGSELVL